MIVVLSDTHSDSGTELTGRTATAVAEADAVVHAGDFTAEATLDAFYDAAGTLYAVHGNADDETVTDRLPVARTVEFGGVRVAVTHQAGGGATGLAMFGRQRDADLVVSGHTHRPSITEADDLVLLNPGSHAESRGYPYTHAELTETETGLSGELLTREGEVRGTFRVEGRT